MKNHVVVFKCCANKFYAQNGIVQACSIPYTGKNFTILGLNVEFIIPRNFNL